MDISNLQAVRSALRERLANDTLFSFLSARIVLRTGVDLSRVNETLESPERLRKVLSVLKEMGYDLTQEIGK